MHTNFWVDEDELAKMFSEKCSLYSISRVAPLSNDEAIAIALSDLEDEDYDAQTSHPFYLPRGGPKDDGSFVAQPPVNVNDDASYAHELYLLEAYGLAKEDEAFARDTPLTTDTTTLQDGLQTQSHTSGNWCKHLVHQKTIFKVFKDKESLEYHVHTYKVYEKRSARTHVFLVCCVCEFCVIRCKKNKQ